MSSAPSGQFATQVLHEASIADAVEAFARDCAQALSHAGLATPPGLTAAYSLRLTDAPIAERSEVERWHGRYRFRDASDGYFPQTDHAGVYFFLDGEGNVLYVGECKREIGNRLGEHLGPALPGGGYAAPGFEGAEYIVVVPFPSDARYLAPALESWLLQRYHFPLNTNGTGRSRA